MTCPFSFSPLREKVARCVFSIEPDEGYPLTLPLPRGEREKGPTALGPAADARVKSAHDEENKGAKTFLLTTFLIESSHSSPCSVKEALSGCRFLSVEKGRCL